MADAKEKIGAFFEAEEQWISQVKELITENARSIESERSSSLRKL